MIMGFLGYPTITINGVEQEYQAFCIKFKFPGEHSVDGKYVNAEL